MSASHQPGGTRAETPERKKEKLDPRVWRVAGVAALGPLITNIDSTVVNVSLSALGQDLHAPLTTLQWVITGYLLALALMLPLSGWLVDRCGAKRVYLGCFSAFTLASLLCGISSSAQLLIAARVLQGMAGGLLAPMAQMMVAREAPHHIARVMSVMVIPVILGPIFGPSLAGLILQRASWHWIFFINLPIGLFAVLLAAWILPPDTTGKRRRSFDILGFLLISPGLVLLLYGLEALSSDPAAQSRNILLLIASLTLLAAFGRHAIRRGPAALVDLQLFRDPSFRASASTQFLVNGLSLGSQMLIPLYLLTVLHLSPSRVGLLLASGGIGALCAYPWMGTITERFGSRRVSASGALIALLASLALAVVPPSSLAEWLICFILFVRTFGMSSISIPSISAAYFSLPKAAVPVATTAMNIVQRIGGPVATTVIAIFLHRGVATHISTGNLHAAGPEASTFTATLWLLFAWNTLTFLAALRLPMRATPKARNETQASELLAQPAVE
ncbi:MAG TPA: DHA2 family efflux MFS transporter permease subunit [Acidobacteriaceae bacterium]